MDFVKINEIVAVGSVIFFVIAPLLGYLINKYILDRYFNNEFKEYLILAPVFIKKKSPFHLVWRFFLFSNALEKFNFFLLISNS